MQGINKLSSLWLAIDSLPTFKGWNPSASLSGWIESRIVCSFMCLGNGSWTKIPFTFSWLLSFSTRLRSSSWEIVSSKWWSITSIPISSALLLFAFTYTLLATTFPTCTTAKPGPFQKGFWKTRISFLRLLRSYWAISFPLIILVISTSANIQ